MKKKNSSWLYRRLFIYSAIFIFLICAVSLGITWYWSFYHFKNIFEDRVIDEYTLKYSEQLGIENEWVLGVSTHSIDVLEATHGDATAEHIRQKALTQEEIYRFYREKVDGKPLLYMISLNNQNGEFLYKYSVIKDIYAEIFPNIAVTFLIFSLFIMFLSLIYIRVVYRQVYASINQLKEYADRLAGFDFETEPLEIVTEDQNIKSLADAFCQMQIKLAEKENLQNTTLQYISHEMKTPIMIIESYAASAKDRIYPKETLEATLDTILAQAERMKIKVASLLQVVKMNTKELNLLSFNLSEAANQVLSNYQVPLGAVARCQIQIASRLMISADPEQIQILMENLVENQLKYCDSIVAIRIFESKNRMIMLFFNDGEQIPNDIKSELFIPFVKGYTGSHGLGLSICQTILLRHRGTIRVLDSRFGTLFQVMIPVFDSQRGR